MAKHLAPGQKWRIEIDINRLDALRRVSRLTLKKMEEQKLCDPETYRRIMRTGIASLHIVARFATHFNISPGELIVWFPVPGSQPERVKLGKGRNASRKPFWDKKNKRRHYKHWRSDEIEKLIRLHDEGLALSHCAMILKRTTRACKVMYWRHKHGKVEETPGLPKKEYGTLDTG